MSSERGGRDHNYFAILGEEPPPKRKTLNLNNTRDFPYLKKNNKPLNVNPTTCPKFIIVKNKDNTKPLKTFNIFLLQKALESITTEQPNSISFTRDGDLLILTKNNQQTTKFLKATKLSNLCDISVSLHPTLNTIKGVIYSTFLSTLTENEIVEGLQNQGATECKKITKFKDGKVINTPLHIITFNAYELPVEVNVAWLKVKVEPYIPSPMQCKNCYTLGHTLKHCKSENKCNVCSSTFHDPSPCIKVECINCKQQHRSNNIKCPTLQKRKDILTYKTLNKCSFREATEAVNHNQKEYISPRENLEEAIQKKVTRPKEQKTYTQNNNNNNLPTIPNIPNLSHTTEITATTQRATFNPSTTQQENPIIETQNTVNQDNSSNHSPLPNNTIPLSNNSNYTNTIENHLTTQNHMLSSSTSQQAINSTINSNSMNLSISDSNNLTIPNVQTLLSQIINSTPQLHNTDNITLPNNYSYSSLTSNLYGSNSPADMEQ